MGFFPYGMGRDPNKWKNPLVFRPERWIPKDGAPFVVSATASIASNIAPSVYTYYVYIYILVLYSVLAPT